jgi:hypothetical protein
MELSVFVPALYVTAIHTKIPVLTKRVLCIMEAEMKDRIDDNSKQKVVMRNAVAMSRKNSTCVKYIGFTRYEVLLM